MTQASTPQEESSGLAPPLLCLAALLALALPQFLRTPLTNDAVLYDLQARMVGDGAVLYRDVLEPNLPGVVWLHLGARTLLGPAAEALRSFDVGVLAVLLVWAAAFLRAARRDAKTAAWFALAATGFYLSMSEWCQTQRDAWALAPALCGLWMRRRHVELRGRAETEPSARRFLPASTFLEGLVWGAAVWIKPHVVIPAFGAWLAGCWFIRSRRGILCDAAWLLSGGVTAGALGIAWLVHSGSWPHFWETMREWNPGYFAAGRQLWTAPRLFATAWRMWPWFALHLVAVPLATRVVCREVPRLSRNEMERSLPSAALLSVFYLGWLGQALFLQHLFDYVHVPAILLAILFLILYTTGGTKLSTAGRVGWAGFALLAVLASPVLRAERLGAWTQCVAGPATPKLRDRLGHFDNPHWDDLERVAEFLRREGAAGHDVCCFNSDFVSLYSRLQLDPPTRFVYLQELLVYFPDRRGEMLEAVAASDHRFVVTDLVGCGMSPDAARQIGPAGPLGPPPGYTVHGGVYPWCCPVVYRAGTYLVHRVDGDVGDSIEPFIQAGSRRDVTRDAPTTHPLSASNSSSPAAAASCTGPPG